MTLEALLERMRDKPAARFGFDDQNDWTAFDLDSAYTIDPQTFLSRGRATPFAGMDVFGECLLTIVGGKIAWQHAYRPQTSAWRPARNFTAGASETPARAVGEVVFNTTMVGYQEIVSDPSYTYQVVVMTYPVIGNYGITDDDFETQDAPPIGGLMVRDYNDQPSNFRYTRTLAEMLEENHIPGICRSGHAHASTRFIRDRGSRRALLTDADTPVEEALGAHRRNARAATTRWSASPAKSAGTPAPPTTASTWWRWICGIKLNIVRSPERPRLQCNRGAVEHLRRGRSSP